MANEMNAKLDELLDKQFLSFWQLVELIVIKKYENRTSDDMPTDSEKKLFVAGVIKDLMNASREGRITLIKSQKKGLIFYEGDQFYEIFRLFLAVITPIIIFLLYLTVFQDAPSGTLREGLSPIKAAFILVVGQVGGMTFVIPTGVIAWLVIQERRAKTPEKKLKYIEELAGVYGADDELFDTDSAIVFVNKSYKFNIPRNPFRVWPEPFFKKNGDFWIIGFAGKQLLLRTDKKTLDRNERIAYLLSRPYEQIPCNLLVARGLPDADMPIQEVTEDSSYLQAKQYVKDKGVTCEKLNDEIKCLEVKIQASRKVGNSREENEYADKREDLLRLLKEMASEKTGHKPKGNAQETFEQNRKALMKDTKEKLPEFSEHIRKSIRFSTGSVTYNPPEPMTWDVEY